MRPHNLQTRNTVLLANILITSETRCPLQTSLPSFTRSMDAPSLAGSDMPAQDTSRSLVLVCCKRSRVPPTSHLPMSLVRPWLDSSSSGEICQSRRLSRSGRTLIDLRLPKVARRRALLKCDEVHHLRNRSLLTTTTRAESEQPSARVSTERTVAERSRDCRIRAFKARLFLSRTVAASRALLRDCADLPHRVGGA